MSEAEFTRNADGSFRIAGSLVFATVRDVLRRSLPILAAESELAIDLSAVTSADSAGLALLIEWFRVAELAKKKLRLIGAPAQLRALAKISELETVLPFA